MATTETVFPDQSNFDYDYETLRTTGVILAVVMFVSGILIALIQIHLVPRFQKQRYLLKLYKIILSVLEKRSLVQEPHQHTNTMVNPLMASVPLPAG